MPYKENKLSFKLTGLFLVNGPTLYHYLKLTKTFKGEKQQLLSVKGNSQELPWCHINFDEWEREKYSQLLCTESPTYFSVSRIELTAGKKEGLVLMLLYALVLK